MYGSSALATLHYHRGHIHESDGDKARALDDYRAVLRHDPGHELAKSRLATLAGQDPSPLAADLTLCRDADKTPDQRLPACDRVLASAAVLQLPMAAILGEEAAAAIARDETPGGRIVLPHTGRVPGIAGSLLASAMALQLFTERLARARGVDPDTIGREDAAQAAAHG